MSYKFVVENTVLEKCIQDVQFNVSTSSDYIFTTKCNNMNLVKITGYIDTEESTVVLYNWALLPATNPECYKEITIEHHKSEKLLRKVTFSKAFVVKYSESYSIDEGVGTFTLYIKQLYGQDIEVTSEASLSSSPTESNSAPEIEEETQRETIDGNNSNTDNSNSVKDTLKVVYTNPAGKTLYWYKQLIKNVNIAIDSALKSKDPGKAVAGKVADYIRNNIRKVTGFNQQVMRAADNSLAGDFDVVTADEIIEVKKSISSVDFKQILKYTDLSNPDFMNNLNKKVVLYIDEAVDMTNPKRLELINKIKAKGVSVVINSLESLKEVLD